MTLAGIELRYLVDTISEQAKGYYVSNIYGINKSSLLFKLHHTDKPDLFLMVSTMGIWITSVKIEQIEPNRLQKRLRSDIVRLRLKEIRQIGSERIAYLVFEGFEREFVLVVEFFGDGNIILYDETGKILALQHSIDVRHRKLSVGLQYTPPLQTEIDILDITEDNFTDMYKSDMVAARWVGRTLGLPKKYAEGVFTLAGIDSQIPSDQLTKQQITHLYNTIKKLVHDITHGNHKPVIITGDRPEVYPVQLKSDQGVPVDSFIQGLDTVFTESLVAQANSIQSSTSNRAITELQTRLDEQSKAIQTVQERSAAITVVAKSFFDMISQGIQSIQDPRSIDILKTHNARVITEKGIKFLLVDTTKIRINIESSLHSIASTLFDEAKHQAAATNTIQAAMNKTKTKLEHLLTKEQNVPDITVSNIRKKSWYERYRWFYTTDGLLAVGGRDAASNSAVIRKQLTNRDKVFHADIFGSPFFILKDADTPSDDTMSQMAIATVCFSRAWREGLYGVRAYWVYPDQVKKSAPSGEFLPKGSFTIEGQRNFIKSTSLKLAVGIMDSDDSYVVTCGPVEPIKQRSIYYSIIEPQGLDLVDAAKKIRLELLEKDETVAKSIPLDDIIRVMPAGKSKVNNLMHGDAHA